MEWISVEDRLPSGTFEEVICVIKEGEETYSTTLTWREHDGEGSPWMSGLLIGCHYPNHRANNFITYNGIQL